jgi:pullulanase/glycogen debranching enzyme
MEWPRRGPFTKNIASRGNNPPSAFFCHLQKVEVSEEKMSEAAKSRDASSSTKVWPGKPYPLGATWDGAGVHFSIFSESATAVDLCFFDAPEGKREVVRIRMPEQTDQIWHVYLPQARPGLLYGSRVSRPYAPKEGHRFNPAKLVLDPYAKAIAGTIRWSDALFGYTIGTRRPIFPRMIATARPACRNAWWWIRRSVGATTRRRAGPGTRR